VHLAEQRHLLQHRATKHLERAAVVVQAHAGEPPDEAIGEHRRQASRQESVVPPLAPSGDHVQVLLEQVARQPHDVVGIVLQVAVERGDQIAARGLDPGLHRRGLAEVAPECDDAHVIATRRTLVLE
jgi:hypothetical protein